MIDENKMIRKLIVHRDLIGWVVEKLKKEDIVAKRTTGNDRNGDILLVNQEDVPRAKEIIREMQSKYSG